MRGLLLIIALVCLLAVPALGAQSATFNGSSQYAVRTISNSSPFTSVGAWRLEFRLTDIASGATYRICDNNHFYVQLNASTGQLTIFSWDGEILDTTLVLNGFTGHYTDIVVRVQKDVPNNRYTVEAFDSASATRFASGVGAASSMSNRNYGSTNYYIGTRSIEQGGSAGLYLNGRIAFFRWYTTLVSYESATKPILYTNAAGLLQYEFEGVWTDSSGNSQTLTPVASPTFNTTPTINPIANAGIDQGGRAAGVTFAVDCSGSAAGDAGPITSYAWTLIAGSGTISSPSSASSNITGIGAGQSTFQCQVGDGTNTATDSLDVGVVSVNANGTVNVGDARLDAIFGPLLPDNSPGSLVMPYYDVNQEESYTVQRNKPSIAPRATETGTLAVTNGVENVVGTGTRFTKDLALAAPSGMTIPLYINGVAYMILTVSDDNHLTLSTVYAGSTASGITSWNQNGASEADNYTGYWGYYDAALNAYIAFYRTGLTKWQTEARRIADSWWSKGGIDYGATHVEDADAPRSIALAGLMVRAIDGKPEYWDFINRYTDYQFNVWVKLRKTYPGFYFGVRDGGYMTWFAFLCSQVLPNSWTLYANGTLAASTGTETLGTTIRTAYFADVLDACVNYYARLQRPDGSFRWGVYEESTLSSGINNSVTSLVVADASQFRTTATCASQTCDLKINDEYLTYTTRSGNTISGITRGRYGTTAASHSSGALVTDVSLGYFEQVFHVGVGIGAVFYDLMRVIQGNPVYQAEYNTLRQAIIMNAAEGMLMGYSMQPVTDTPSVNSRYIAYALHSWGDWGPTHDGMPDTVPAWPTIADIRDARQNVVTWTHVPAYAYHFTGVQWFRDQIDELLSANWGKAGYSGTIGTSDGYYALQNYFTTDNGRRMKEYNEWHRYIGRAFAVRFIAPIPPANLPPFVTIKAGDRRFPNGTTNPGFTARGVDPEGGALTYLWTNAGVGTPTLSGATTAIVTVTGALSNDTAYALKVCATDIAGNTTCDWVNFRLSGVDTELTPPVANVISQSVSLGAGTTSSATALDASNSTASGGRTVHYRWFQTSGPAATISNAKIANPTISGLTPGNFTFRVFVYDNLTRTVEETGTDAVDVRVTVAASSATICNWHTNPACTP